MPPKGKRRNVPSKPKETEELSQRGSGDFSGPSSTTADDQHDDVDEQNHNMGAGGDDGNNVNYVNGGGEGKDPEAEKSPSPEKDEEISFSSPGDLSSSSSSSLTQVTAANSAATTLLLEDPDGTDEEESEVVISASLNLGQDSKVELKTEKVKVIESPQSVSSSPREKEKVAPAVSSPKGNSQFSRSEPSSMTTTQEQPPPVLSSEPPSSSSSYATASTVNSLNSSTVSAPPDINYSNAILTDEQPPPELELPATVSTLSINNARIYLIGTAHFSTQSQEDVTNVVKLTQPDCILLELCPSRRNILHFDEEMLLREAGDISFAKITATLRNAPPGSSRVQSLLHLLLLSMSASLTKKLGMAPGGEFRAAVKEADKLPKKPTLLLGDRPFNVTLARAIASLTFMQKAKLAWQFLLSSDDITKEEIEKCKERDLLEKMLSEMTGEFPSITEVFVNERDYYLAHTLYMSSVAIGEAKQKQGGKGEAVVVAVVGMGHVIGMCKNFGHTTEQEFSRIASLPPTSPPSTTKWLIKTGIKLTFYGVMTYGAYKLFNRIDIFKKFENGLKLGIVRIK